MELEDSEVQLAPVASAGEEVTKPRKLGRLRKAGSRQPENAQPNAAALDSPVQPAPKSAMAALEDSASDQEEPGPAAEAERSEQEEQGGVDGSDAEVAAPAPSDKEEDYFDEEDELEERFARRATQRQAAQQAATAAEASEDEPGGSEPEASGVSGGSDGGDRDGECAGSPGTMELLAADTQRILRETAVRDRLGKGHKIEIKPLSSILDRIKQRQALAIARAPKPALPDVGSFEDILAQARQQAPAPALPCTARGFEDGPSTAEPAAVAEAAAGDGQGTPGSADAAGGHGVGTEGDDLLILGPDEEEGEEGGEGPGGMRLVELPSTAKKRSMPFIPTQDADFEDEVLIDDGYDSEEQSVREEEEEGGSSSASSEDDEGEEGSSGSDNEGGSEVQGDEEEGVAEEAEVEGDDGAEAAGGSSPARRVDSGEGAAGQEQPSPGPASADSQRDEEMENAEAEPSSASGEQLAAAGGAADKRQEKLKRIFLDMEAELSDEEGAAASEDEDEDLDEQGQLAGLIGSAKETAKDRKLRQLLHRQWAEQQDEKELQALMAGLRNGFRRRRGAGFLDDEDDELAGRRRRARVDGEDDDEAAAAGGALPWPSAFGEVSAGSDDEAEDEELLRKAKQGQLLADSQGLLGSGGGSGDDDDGIGGGGGGSGAWPGGRGGGIPLDEGSQEVLGLLMARGSGDGGAGPGSILGGSVPQRGACGSGGTGLPRSRFAPGGAAAAAVAVAGSAPPVLPSFGSDPTSGRLPGGARGMSRGPSFVGRQPTVQRGSSISGLGVGSGRSFVFGREDSSSALPDKGAAVGEDAAAGAGGGAAVTGPTSFANLRQMAGLPGGASSSAAGSAGAQPPRKRAGASLVSRLKAPGQRAGKELLGSQPAAAGAGADAAVAAVAALVHSSGVSRRGAK